jgi:hypothetical protein
MASLGVDWGAVAVIGGGLAFTAMVFYLGVPRTAHRRSSALVATVLYLALCVAVVLTTSVVHEYWSETRARTLSEWAR